jgi:hypothetical protein
MVITENIRLRTKQIMIVISVHILFLIIYGVAHEMIDTTYSMSAHYLILLLFSFGPIIAAYFLSTRFARQGTDVLLGILPANLFYNIVERFFPASQIIFQSSTIYWRIIFEVSFGTILVLEVIAFWFATRILRDIHVQMNTSHDTSSG